MNNSQYFQLLTLNPRNFFKYSCCDAVVAFLDTGGMADHDCLQLTDGYAKIVHGVFDALARYRMPTGYCWNVLMVILRKTYGFGQKEAQISMQTFVRRTGIRRQHIGRAISALTHHNIIRTHMGSKRIPSYSYNKYSSTWKPWERDRPKPKKEPTRVQTGTHTGSPSYKDTYINIQKEHALCVSHAPKAEENRLEKNEPPQNPAKKPHSSKTPPDKIGQKLGKLDSNGHFDRFWAAYPKKKSKLDAKKAWGQMIKNPATMIETLIKAVECQRESQDWRREGGRFIPYPATWLRAGGWMDEVKDEEEERNAMVRRIARRIEKAGGVLRKETK